jgi:DNA recombination protein RmuC
MEIWILLASGVLTGGCGYLLGLRKAAASLAELSAKNTAFAQLEQQLSAERSRVLALTADLSRTESDYSNLGERMQEQRQELDGLRAQFLHQFQQVSNQVLIDTADHFQRSSSEKLDQLLQPLKERIKDFEDKVDSTYEKSLRDQVSLKEQISHLAGLNQQISQDAINLTKALKGEQKTQGNWGEYLLESLLQKSGLERNLHYRREEVRRGEDDRIYRPDVILLLPDDKHLVIDSKLSLNAYEAYCNCDNPEQQSIHLQQHLTSLRTHFTDLSRKNYQHLQGLHSPDFVLMYVPIEPAFNLAMQHDQEMFMEALDRNVVVVTTSTLLATLRTVASVWRQENQQRNVLKIAEESGKLYDKFVNFLDDLRDIGVNLDRSHKAYQGALNKLSEGNGNLIRKADLLKKLGARTTKKLDTDWMRHSVAAPEQLPNSLVTAENEAVITNLLPAID